VLPDIEVEPKGTTSFAGRGYRRMARFLGSSDERWELLLPLAILVGLASGLVAVGLRRGVHHLGDALLAVSEGRLWLRFLIPGAGAFLGAWIVANLFREPPGHGVPGVIRSVCRWGGRLKRRTIFSHWLGSLVNVSAGGSAGLEGPIVVSGAAIGSTVGGLFKLDERRRSLLLACGVAGGISAVFNAPMTGALFAAEVVLAEWTAFSIVPIIVSAAVAAQLERLFLGDHQSFLHAPFSMGPLDFAACAVLGLIAGVASLALTASIEWVDRLARKVPRHRLLAPLLFGLAVGAVGLMAPEAIGEGYDLAQSAIRSELPAGLALVFVLLFVKGAATSMTLGSGAPGGVFAPCLVLGAVIGVGFCRAMGLALPEGALAVEGSYALVSMAGLVAGVMHAPLTAILLVMEVTAGYDVILPLMIVSVLSLIVVRRFGHHSMYTRELAETGDLLRPGTDKRILSDIRVSEALDEDVLTVSPNLTLAQFVGVVRRSKRNHFPVLEADSRRLVGMLDLGDIREILVDPDLAKLTLVGTVMDAAPASVPLGSTLVEALAVFEESGAWVLPVLDGDVYFGLLSKSRLFDRYRAELSAQTDV